MIGRMLAAGLAGLLLLSTTATARAEEPAPLWRLVAVSQLIVVGTPQPDPAQLSSTTSAFVPLPVEDVTVLQGVAHDPLVILHYSADVPYAPSDAAVLAAQGRPTVLFLLDADTGEGPKTYFAQGPASLHDADGGFAAATKAEIAWQAAYLRGWKADETVPHSAEVRRLIEELKAIKARTDFDREAMERQDDVFRRLEALGPDAVPAIVMLMDDRTPLLFHRLSLLNQSPDAFERARHYGPELVVDALSAILNQITGESFGFIYNGGSEAERVHDVNGWRIYLGRDLPRS